MRFRILSVMALTLGVALSVGARPVPPVPEIAITSPKTNGATIPPVVVSGLSSDLPAGISVGIFDSKMNLLNSGKAAPDAKGKWSCSIDNIDAGTGHTIVAYVDDYNPTVYSEVTGIEVFDCLVAWHRPLDRFRNRSLRDRRFVGWRGC